MPGMARPDAVIVVLNSNNLHTHLVLAGRVIALGLPTLVLLNMADELHKQDGPSTCSRWRGNYIHQSHL